MSSHKSGSSSLSRAERIASGRLRMDRNPTHARIGDPSLAAGRRKEIDNVMKRARAASPGSWDRKLLEVEEKDPNRWRHSGYKQLYLEGDRSSDSRSRSRSRSCSPRSRRSPPVVSTTSSSHHRSNRDANGISSSYKSSRGDVSSSRNAVSSSRDRDRERDKHGKSSSRPRPPSPLPKRCRSPMGSSLSSCSDDSCSVCSLSKPQTKRRSRSRSFSVPRSSNAVNRSSRQAAIQSSQKLPKLLNSGNANAGPSTLSLRRNTSSSIVTSGRINVATTKKPKSSQALAVSSTSKSSAEIAAAAAAAKKRSRDEKVLEWQRNQITSNKSRPRPPTTPPVTPPHSPHVHKDRLHKVQTKIKKEGEHSKKKNPSSKKGDNISAEVIAAALAGDSTGQDDSSSDESSQHHHQSETRLTLSERFGKMAQWSADRSNAMQNMRITRGTGLDAGALTVHIEEPLRDHHHHHHQSSPPLRYHSPAPEGHYPEELLSSAPVGMLSWDDVRVRYDYYKKRGYLRGLSLSDYIKWEEWWYRYQQWLKQERNYERWLRTNHRRRRH